MQGRLLWAPSLGRHKARPHKIGTHVLCRSIPKGCPHNAEIPLGRIVPTR